MREQEKYAKNKTLRGNKNIAEFQQSYEFACLGRVYWYWCWVRICEYSIWGTLYTYINKAYMSACYLSALKTVFEMLSDFYDRSVSNVYGERTRPTLLHRCDFNLFHHFGSAKRYKYLLRMLACEYRTAIAFAWWLCCTLIYTARWSFAFQQTPCLSYNVSGTQKYKDMSRLFAPHPNPIVKASKSGFRQKKRAPETRVHIYNHSCEGACGGVTGSGFARGGSCRYAWTIHATTNPNQTCHIWTIRAVWVIAKCSGNNFRLLVQYKNHQCLRMCAKTARMSITQQWKFFNIYISVD